MVLVVKLLRNGSTDIHEILYAYRGGLFIFYIYFSSLSLRIKKPWQTVKIEHSDTY